MKQLKKLSLSKLVKAQLNKREQNRVRGGDDCCACYCVTGAEARDLAIKGMDSGTAVGYGIGKFA